MRIVGLTGGIASGKSTVSDLFNANGFPVVDADLLARDILKKGTRGWKKVVAAFGKEILQDNGEVDRPKLGHVVFSDFTKRQLLNRLLAPYISSGIFWEVLKLWVKGYKVIILDVPLLFEAKMNKWTKPIIVVWVDPETQLRRLMARDRTSAEDAEKRINAQMPLDLKRSKADIVIDNTGSLDDLDDNIRKALVQVTKPLTWCEFGLSRQGAMFAWISILAGVVIRRKIFIIPVILPPVEQLILGLSYWWLNISLLIETFAFPGFISLDFLASLSSVVSERKCSLLSRQRLQVLLVHWRIQR